MDDQQGHVIDGTARARQWRRSKAKARPAPDATETRSDAPKSFAGSLLVPADMLSEAIAPDGPSTDGEQARAAGPPEPTHASDRASAEAGAQQNPFLVPDTARVPNRSTSALQWMTAALERARDRIRRGVPQPSRRHLAMLRAPRPTRLLPVAALAGVVAVTAVILTRPHATHPSSESPPRAAGTLGTRELALSAAINRFARRFGGTRSNGRDGATSPGAPPRRHASSAPTGA